VPEGTIGELYIEGPLVSRGYLHNAELTAQRFVSLKTQRVYRTGDLVKRHPDGHITYLGRNDDQVKIRGHRIELKEVEHALLSYSPVRQCLVLAKKDAHDTIYLAGYIVPAEGFDKESLLKTVRGQLPEYMIPSRWVLLDKWPLTVNNKIDRQALPEPGNDHREPGPEEGTAGILRHIWCRLLGTAHIGPDDDFFTLGGDSLKLMQLNYDLSRQFSLEWLSAELMTPLTIGRLARFIDGRTEGPQKKDPEPEGFDPQLASPTQRDLFLQKKLHPGETFPNSSITLQIAGALDPDRLTNAFAHIIRANDSLRTGYYLNRGKVCQRIAEDVQFIPEWIPCNADDIDEEIRKVTRPFDFGCPPLLRAFVFLLSNGDRYLHLDMPHINSDGESIKIMMDELESAYNTHGGETAKPQFADFQRRVHAYTHSGAYTTDASFWSRQLSRDIPTLSLDVQRAGREATYVVTPFPFGLLPDMNRYLRARRLTRFQLLLAGYFQVLYHVSAATDCCVLLPVHNRWEKSMDRIVGLLSNVVLVRMKRMSDQPLDSWMEALKTTVLEAFRHQRYPFEDIRRIWRDNGYAGDHLAQVFFGYHQNRKTYTFGEARLGLHIPIRYKENLILSAAVFETPGDLTLRISSRPGGFGEAGLGHLAKMYFDFLHRIVHEDGTNTHLPDPGAAILFRNTNI
jgi:acyl carrier protein